MIELNSKTQQDFLNREWVQKLLDAGVDMSDAKYVIQTIDEKDTIQYIGQWDHEYDNAFKKANIVPTYTVSELLYKLHEWIYYTIEGEEYCGPLKVAKDAPFYFAYYDLKNKDGKETTEEFYAEFEYPIESLAYLLIQCHRKGIGDVGNISSK